MTSDPVVTNPAEDRFADFVRLPFEDYVVAESVALLRFAYLVCGNISEAEDVVQDALVAAYPKWRRISRGNPGAYLRRAIVNARISWWRRHQRLAVVSYAEIPEQAAGGDPATDLAGRDWARRLCAELPHRQRAAVVLRVYEDRSFAEIANVLVCSEAYARTLVSRGLTSLRASIEKGDTHV